MAVHLDAVKTRLKNQQFEQRAWLLKQRYSFHQLQDTRCLSEHQLMNIPRSSRHQETFCGGIGHVGMTSAAAPILHTLLISCTSFVSVVAVLTN